MSLSHAFSITAVRLRVDSIMPLHLHMRSTTLQAVVTQYFHGISDQPSRLVELVSPIYCRRIFALQLPLHQPSLHFTVQRSLQM